MFIVIFHIYIISQIVDILNRYIYIASKKLGFHSTAKAVGFPALKNYNGVETFLKRLEGNGDFRSEECISYLNECDVVVTNPPFSLFLDYIFLLLQHKKDYIIMGNMNAITNETVFEEIKNGRLRFGDSIRGGDREFRVPPDYPLYATNYRTDNHGVNYVRVSGVRWFTNLTSTRKKRNLILYKRYTPEFFPKYDDYNAINVDKTEEIPYDYNGMMGVPLSFLDKYNPNQFEIVDIQRLHVDGKALYQRILVKHRH